jgi:tetratricopeptide repeat protein 39
LLACRGDKEGARVQLDLVMSGKSLEVNAAGRKGKYSLEVRRCGLCFSCLLIVSTFKNELHLRTNAALEALQLDKRV